MDFCQILGVKTAAATMEEATAMVCRHYRNWRGQYITFANTHAVVMADDRKEYRKAQNNAVLTFADGYPVASYERKKGYKRAERIAGPDFMTEIFIRSAKEGYRHYFYGSSPQTLRELKKNLQEKYPRMVIAGMYAPPYTEKLNKDYAQDIKRINDTKPDFVWIGMGAPKQELWMYQNKGKVDGLMLGVGAGFDFHAGTRKRAPRSWQRIGMEWMYRLLQEPKRLLKRYLVTNSKFLWKTLVQRK
ncbi:MAG: WecB/TagA/CpsF family glycosyltransferase [Lachnospiraceae bacterium]|nr:WecB/TagA/CpsF family glycosyltransferase [Lachnospiraceae bacterium]